MKAKELMEFLSSVDPDLEVVLQRDAEGNGYSPLCGADSNAVYAPDTTWSGDVYDMAWTAADACMDDEEWEKIKAMPRCVVLFPIN